MKKVALPKFNFKEFDYKGFFLKYGEWIGLGIALAIALPVLVSGFAKGVTSGSPATNAKDAEQLADKVNRDIQISVPDADATAPTTKYLSTLEIKFKDPVDYEKYATDQPWFIPSTLEDVKRRNPDILSPTDFQVRTLYADVPVNIILEDENKIGVIHIKKVELSEKMKRKLKAMGLRPPGGGGGSPRGPGGGMGGGSLMGAGGRGGRGPVEQKIRQIEYVDFEKIDITPDVEVAKEIHPTHMVVVSACFPFKEQLDLFRRALRKTKLKDFLSMISKGEAYWEFKQVDVERRVLKNGKVIEEWQPFNAQLEDSMKYFIRRVPEMDEDDPELKKFNYIINPGLVMPRPPLARGSYPPDDLAGIRKTLEALKGKEAGPAKRELSELAKRSSGKGGYDIWNPYNPVNAEEQTKPSDPSGKPSDPSDPADMAAGPGTPGRITPVQPYEKEGAASNIENTPIPEMALIRIVDTDVTPGNTYQYRMKVRMLNPNYNQRNVASRGMRDTQFLTSKEWATVPDVHIPADTFWYVTGTRRDNDKVTLQIHRWLDHVALDRNNPQATVPVAEWIIQEATNAYRGEYIGGVHPAKVPVWRTDLAKYELARGPRTVRPQVPVDFSVRSARAQDPALLIDFEGGSRATRSRAAGTTEEDPVRVLVLTPEGKLIVRNAEHDINDEVRKTRLEEYKKWINELEGKNKKPTEQLFDKRGGA